MQYDLHFFIYTCINSYKNTRGFPRPPTANSRRRAFTRNVNFSFIVSGSERTFAFSYILELTIGYESNFQNNAIRKRQKYENLVKEHAAKTL